MSDAGSPAVLFDLDGTLVDTNFHHAVAWQRAFAEVGRDVSCWRIIELLGRSGDELIAESIGDDLAKSRGDDAKDSHDSYFGEYEPVLQTTAGARDLLQAITDQGWQTVLATSAGEKTLKLLRRVLDADDLVGHVTSSADADRGKPHPELSAQRLSAPNWCRRRDFRRRRRVGHASRQARRSADGRFTQRRSKPEGTAGCGRCRDL